MGNIMKLFTLGDAHLCMIAATLSHQTVEKIAQNKENKAWGEGPLLELPDKTQIANEVAICQYLIATGEQKKLLATQADEQWNSYVGEV